MLILKATPKHQFIPALQMENRGTDSEQRPVAEASIKCKGTMSPCNIF